MILRARSVAEAVAAQRAGASVAAGLTALQLGWGEDGPEGDLVDITGLPGLDGIALRDGVLRAGALVTLERLRSDPRVAAGWPAIPALLRQVGALGVRNLGTLGGNIGWGAGDLVPLLLVLGARVRLPDGTVPLAGMPPGALILEVEVPAAPRFVFAEKIGHRAAFSPSLVTVAAAEGGDGLRVALGGGPNRPGLLAPEGRDAPALSRCIAASGRCATDDFAGAAHRADVAARVLAHALREAA